MTGVFDVNGGELVNAVSKSLKEVKSLKAPEWSKFVKTGAHVERPPQNADWWYVRLASILRTVYVSSPVGVQRLRSRYGGRKKMGYAPKMHVRAGGKILRVALQMLEKEGLVKNVERKGRTLTDKGRSLLDKTASSLIVRSK
ncbi:MAG TPA: 30S ribosomal protein S19e [Candidatus Nanoarchaeia archaeon]|nr:30S ribosomal protein S19e [Candidatus Nanoarchaeia archaeon]